MFREAQQQADEENREEADDKDQNIWYDVPNPKWDSLFIGLIILGISPLETEQPSVSSQQEQQLMVGGWMVGT